MSTYRNHFPAARAIIGVIHLPALPGYPGSPGLTACIDKALADLEALEAGGADGVLVENEYDRPHTLLAARETIACMTRITSEVVAAARQCVVGIEILINDPEASLGVAQAAGASFIRTDYFTDPMFREEYGGAMRIDAPGLLAYRERIGADEVMIMADIQVKYARLMVERSLASSAQIAFEAGADAVIVSGDATGDPARVPDLALAKSGAGDRPVLIGSGLDAANATDLLAPCDGAVVGTSLKTGEMIDADRVSAIVAAAWSFKP
ncbi:MAG: BtpA/SgcQ family protein [Alphaproteobacteria bacterium]|nr:BtpA/SgcQ family protein [Rhodospirillaceae bacterium]MBT6510920.1 BtpA/SgcQ family protein [Rhodospirillaceae bacterium]MBT7646696.1 BtpA/SgcQ family protein [Rhodospirillaceae bacterium]MDG2483188.1 BtpA/SgcQ family protein [Alphaproteobacteria bacterium]